MATLNNTVINALAMMLVSSAFANPTPDADGSNVTWYVGRVVWDNGKDIEMYAVLTESGEFEALDACNINDEDYNALKDAVKNELAKRNA